MKIFKRILAIAIVAAVAFAPASAQVRFGVKAGVAINKLSFDKEILSTNNRAGFTGGVMTEIGIPVVGLCVDASLLYAHRNSEITDGSAQFKRDFIDIPINLKYKLSFLGSGNVFSPFITTGPDFSILLSKKEGTSEDGTSLTWKNKSFNTAWNIGFGFELMKHVQIAASYSFGLNKAIEKISGFSTNETSKDKYWTITAAYLF
ncbi:MAG: PorT family protein [Muribaculaceae bacterium]|nr:PorT family protein [Muribaculaceae bacterium]